ncbi:hypothetical protein AGMMS5026_00930 [Endomicrobiia bacterium]|nr:hypothetical protein AGMMS49523_05970 [Endomicrobiia bacterium]GHT11669.1 hypothetical protein AGMMS49571_02350 [Endomicrobiia bacterium]GHT20481.1 hypothetical protein AGMMS49929_07190 [Endomicrobiia bacterium]GHT26739.1 hypothetical protein AGMMS49995_04080 [Endomicrobiia bacterium]GHT29502.1 hypothetical protein AGMMS5026_00930 [Endomicrobiia bacterium]
MNGVFVNPAISSGKPGLIFGETVQFISQIEGIVIEYFIMLRNCQYIYASVDKRSELMSKHGENAYPSFTGLD